MAAAGFGRQACLPWQPRVPPSFAFTVRRARPPFSPRATEGRAHTTFITVWLTTCARSRLLDPCFKTGIMHSPTPPHIGCPPSAHVREPCPGTGATPPVAAGAARQGNGSPRRRRRAAPPDAPGGTPGANINSQSHRSEDPTRVATAPEKRGHRRPRFMHVLRLELSRVGARSPPRARWKRLPKEALQPGAGPFQAVWPLEATPEGHSPGACKPTHRSTHEIA